ncbi:MAG: hypothetical protein PVH91_10860 [Pseudomonadales bacterium]|jgi:hypothetical protein
MNDDNPHFQRVPDRQAAAALLDFEPSTLRHTAGYEIESLSVHLLDHRKRELPPRARSLEAHYGAFVFSQKRCTPTEAARLALSERYGSAPKEARIAGHPGRVYDLGEEVAPDDIDGRPPAVVVWHDGDMFYLIASDRLPASTLAAIAASIDAG